MQPIRNVHQRRFDTRLAEVWALVEQLGSPGDCLWPKDRWPAMRVPHPITVGDQAGHADIAYVVDEYRPREALWFRFDPACGLDGRHGVTVEQHGDFVTLTHRLEANAVGRGRFTWPLMIRAMHDQLVEELLDNAERMLGPAVLVPPTEQQQLNGPSRLGATLRFTFATLDRLRAIPAPIARVTASAGLATAAAIHALWALGMVWPGRDRVDLARKVADTDTFPSSATTWLVAIMLGASTTLPFAGKHRFVNSAIDKLVTRGLIALATILALRGLGGLTSSSLRTLVGRSNLFTTRDLLFYSPLCVVLAAASASLALQRDRTV
jgi:Protein of unknown function (DUF3995)